MAFDIPGKVRVGRDGERKILPVVNQPGGLTPPLVSMKCPYNAQR